MVIDINPLLKGEKKVIEVNYFLNPIEELDDVVFSENILVVGSVTDMAGYISLKLDANVTYTTTCARCLKEVQAQKRVSFEKTVVVEGTSLQNEENDDYIAANDGLVDADEALIEQVILEMPMRHLCNENCKGLCPKCGADLNSEECHCDLSEPDPRFDVLRKLLQKD